MRQLTIRDLNWAAYIWGRLNLLSSLFFSEILLILPLCPENVPRHFLVSTSCILAVWSPDTEIYVQLTRIISDGGCQH